MGDMRKVCLDAKITSACGKLLVAALASRCAALTRGSEHGQGPLVDVETDF